MSSIGRTAVTVRPSSAKRFFGPGRSDRPGPILVAWTITGVCRNRFDGYGNLGMIWSKRRPLELSPRPTSLRAPSQV